MFNKKEYQQQYYEDNKEHILQKNKEWVKANRERSNTIKRKYKQTEKGKQTEMRTREKNRKHITARNKINYLVNGGYIEREACAICGSTIEVDAHHESYDEPFIIIWLCKKHHDIATKATSTCV